MATSLRPLCWKPMAGARRVQAVRTCRKNSAIDPREEWFGDREHRPVMSDPFEFPYMRHQGIMVRFEKLSASALIATLQGPSL